MIIFSSYQYITKAKNSRDAPNMTHTLCVMHTHDVTNLHNTTPCEKTQMKPRHETQQTFTSISPSDQSEEVHPLMMIDRCQTENNMKEL